MSNKIVIDETELQHYKDLIDAVDRYRVAHSLYESNGKKTTELGDSYTNMLVVCDLVKILLQ